MRPLLLLLALTLLCGCGTRPGTRAVRHRPATFTSAPTLAPSPRRTATATRSGAPPTATLAAQPVPPPTRPAALAGAPFSPPPSGSRTSARRMRR